MKSLKGYFFILGATTFWGISATIAKFLFTHEIDTLILVQMRMTLSFVALTAVFLAVRPSVLRVKARDLYRFALMGIIGGAGSNFTYYFTISRTNVATAILLQYMAPLLVLVYAASTREERIGPVQIAAGVISLAGCFLAVAGRDFSIINISRIGLLSGIASAGCWAFANIWLRRLLRDYGVWTSLIWSFFFASLFWLFFNPPWAIAAAHITPELWAEFFGFAMISVLIPHSLYFGGLRYLAASRAIITATFEPVVAIFTAAIFLGEALTALQAAGAALVIAAVAVLQIRKESPVPVAHSE